MDFNNSFFGLDVNGDSMTINTDTLILRDNGLISSSNYRLGKGQAGDITINASNFVELIGISPEGKTSQVTLDTLGSGNAGNLNINTRRLSIRDGGYITTETSLGSTGKGGEITINATDLVEVIGKSPDGKVFSSVNTSTGASGDSGGLNITTRRLHVADWGFVSTGTVGTGRGGDINIKANDVDIVATPTNNTDFADGIFSSTGSSGNAGDIKHHNICFLCEL